MSYLNLLRRNLCRCSEGSNGSPYEEGQEETSRVQSVTPLKVSCSTAYDPSRPKFTIDTDSWLQAQAQESRRAVRRVSSSYTNFSVLQVLTPSVLSSLPGPGPSPERAQTSLMKPPSAQFTLDLHRRTGSVNSMRFAPASGSPPSEKPPSSGSVRHARSQSFKSIGIGSIRCVYTKDCPRRSFYLSHLFSRTVTPDMDDVSSIAQSSPGMVTIRRTESERIKILRESDYCGDLEPHKAFCKHCSKWVNLGKQQTYALKPWEAHRRRCDQAKSVHSGWVFTTIITPAIAY